MELMMNLQLKLLAGTLILAVMGLQARSSHACTMALPNPGPLNEYEIEIEYEDYDFDTNKVRYKVEIEVEVQSPTAPAQCKCALNLGSTTSAAPSTFDVVFATVGLRTDEEDIDLIPFAGFVRDSEVEGEVASLLNFQEGSTSFGFSLDVSPFEAPTVGVGETLALIFEIEFDLDQYNHVNGSPIQFGAGSNEPGHALNLFSGYQANLQLPSLSSLPSADFDADGDIDGGDFLAFQRGYGIEENAKLRDGDADHDGEIDDDDFKVWENLYGTGGIGASAESVPEPSSSVLLAFVVGISFVQRRRV
jgi:hypothetical protein